MIVFKYFCQKTDHFSQRVIEKATAEVIYDSIIID